MSRFNNVKIQSLSSMKFQKTKPRYCTLMGHQPGMVQELALCLSPPEGTVIEQAVWFDFTATNNEYEYEALIVGMKKAKLIDVQNLVYSL